MTTPNAPAPLSVPSGLTDERVAKIRARLGTMSLVGAAPAFAVELLAEVERTRGSAAALRKAADDLVYAWDQQVGKEVSMPLARAVQALRAALEGGA